MADESKGASASEIWLPIARFPSYEVSDIGNVRSIDRLCRTGPPPGMYLRKGRLMRPSFVSPGKYLAVNIKGTPRLVHVLVAETFIGPKPKGLDTAHLNGVSTDNRLENLAYTTRSENNRHITDHGRRKLTREQVSEIRERTWKYGDKSDFERELGLARGTVKHILNGRLYAVC